MASASKNPDSPLLVAPLDQFNRDDISRAGGKGANLGELLRAGFPVPGAFIVTTAAYDLLLERSGLTKKIPNLLQTAGDGEAIRESILAAEMPPELHEAVCVAYRNLGRGAVAVRSSATSEDSSEATFAGQQDSYLNIIGEEALIDAVHRCWASLWTERAIAYRERYKLKSEHAHIAVVVQRMVKTDAAGVLFTANPMTGERSHVVINASPGLGKAVVSGLVTPDHFVLDKFTARVKERRRGRQEVVVQPLSGGGTKRVRNHSTGSDWTLSDELLRQLNRFGIDIERHFGSPQDVEWAVCGHEIWIVQSRPMTALPEPPPKFGRLSGLIIRFASELMPIRPYPLDVSGWSRALYNAASRFASLLGIGFPSPDEMFVEEDGVIVRFAGIVLRPAPGALFAPFRMFWQAIRYNPVHWQSDPLLASVKTRTYELEKRDFSNLSWNDLVATLHESLEIPLVVADFRMRYFPRPVIALGLLWILIRLLGSKVRVGVLVSGVQTKTLELNRTLEEMAKRIRSDSSLSKAFSFDDPGKIRQTLESDPKCHPFLNELNEFMDRYGQRPTVTIFASQPTWKEVPEVVLVILKGLSLAEPNIPSGKPLWELERDELLRHPFLRMKPVRAMILKLLENARYLTQVREDARFYIMLPLPVARRIIFECGKRLVSVGILVTADDIFHLKLSELDRVRNVWPPPPKVVQEMKALVLARKAKRLSLAGTPLVDPRWIPAVEVSGDALLSGTPGSPGVAEGIVRVIRGSSEFGKLRPGDVLVAPYIDPGWTPLFRRAVAVVVDTGASASHAAIVAREYGIPAVMATREGTRRLADGQRVRVDGNSGLVFAVAVPNSEGVKK